MYCLQTVSVKVPTKLKKAAPSFFSSDALLSRNFEKLKGRRTASKGQRQIKVRRMEGRWQEMNLKGAENCFTP